MTEQQKLGFFANKTDTKNTKHFSSDSESSESESSDSDSTDIEKNIKPPTKKTKIVETQLPPTSGGKRKLHEEKQESLKKQKLISDTEKDKEKDKEPKISEKTITQKKQSDEKKITKNKSDDKNESKKKEDDKEKKTEKKEEEKEEKKTTKKIVKETIVKETEEKKDDSNNTKKINKPRKKKSNIKIWKQEEPTTKIYKIIKMAYEFERPPPTKPTLFMPTILENETVSREEYNQMKNILRSHVKNCEAWIQHYQYFIYDMLENVAFENQKTKFDELKRDYKEKHSYPFPKGKKYMN
jgi:hypothetical protein